MAKTSPGVHTWMETLQPKPCVKLCVEPLQSVSVQIIFKFISGLIQRRCKKDTGLNSA